MDFSSWGSLTQEQKDVILDGPALAPPTGVVSNFDNPPNRDGLTLGVIITSVILATTFVLIRIYSKVFVTKKISIPDGMRSFDNPLSNKLDLR